MVTLRHSMIRTSIYESIPVLITVMVIAAIQPVGAGQRRVPPPTGELVGSKSWAYELLDPCYLPQFNLPSFGQGAQSHNQPSYGQEAQSHHLPVQEQTAQHSGHRQTSALRQESGENVHTQAFVSEEGVKYMTNKRRKRDINEADEANSTTNGESVSTNEDIDSNSFPGNSSDSHTRQSQQQQQEPSHNSSAQEVLRPSFEEYHSARLSIIHSVLQVGGYLETLLTLEMGGEECVGLDLQTLADYPPVIQHHFLITALQLYGYLTRVRAHLLVMLSDWDDTRMMSCGTINRKLSIIAGLRRFDVELKALLCALRIDLLRLGVDGQDLWRIGQPVLDTVIYRYPSCLSKKMRDCLVVNKLEQAFNIAIHSMTRG